jgi:hypothetical protein
MTFMSRKFAPIALALLAIAAVVPVVPASAAGINSRDCKLYGICQPDQGPSTYPMASVGGPYAVTPQSGWDSRDCRHYGICPAPLGSGGSNQSFTGFFGN